MTIKRGLSSPRRVGRTVWERYAVSALSLIVAFAAFKAFPPLFKAAGTGQLILALAVLIAAWYGGLGPGVFATSLILLLAWPAELSAPNLMRVLVFATLGLICSVSMGSLRR